MATATLIERIRRNPSPRIRRQLAKAGIAPESFGLEDLPRIEPLTARALDLDALDDPVADLRLSDAPSAVRLGTIDHDGCAVVLTWTARDLRRVAEQGARALGLAGVRAGMKLANTLDGGFATPGSLILGDVAEALGALDVPLGPIQDESQARAAIELVDRIAVDVLVLDPASARTVIPKLREAAPACVRGVVWLGTPRPPLDVAAWQRCWLSVPEASVFAGIECAEGNLHLDPDLLPEIVAGRLVLTSLASDAPILRFDTGRRGELSRRACVCARPGALFIADSGA